MIQVNDKRHCLYTVVDPETNEFLHVGLFSVRTTQLAVLFFRKVRDQQQFENATALTDTAPYFIAALDWLGAQFRICRYVNRNSVVVFFMKQRRGRGFEPSLSGRINAKLNTTFYAFEVVSRFVISLSNEWLDMGSSK